jgi:hypothetical protein
MWVNPVPFDLIATADSQSFEAMPEGFTGLPLHPHVGSFGYERRNHTHEGVDLYAPQGTPVYAVEDCYKLSSFPFTGPAADSPWWNDTKALMVRGASGVVVYGEIIPLHFALHERIKAGQMIGHVETVLKKNKGRPMSMLHLEFYEDGVQECATWEPGQPQPQWLQDPTPLLRHLAK